MINWKLKWLIFNPLWNFYDLWVDYRLNNKKCYIWSWFYWYYTYMSTNFYDRQLLRSVIKKPHFCLIRHICQRFFIIHFHFRDFWEKKLRFKEDFWVFHNDSLGINPDNSYDGCLQFWSTSWPTCQRCDFKNITSGTDRIEKIFQVVNEGGFWKIYEINNSNSMRKGR